MVSLFLVIIKMIIMKVCIDFYGSVYFVILKRFIDRLCLFGWIF